MTVTKDELKLYDDPNDLISDVEKMTKGQIVIRDSWKLAEKMVHTTAFEYYYNLGEKRSLAKTARYMKVQDETVKKWSSKFHWVERVRERDMIRLTDNRPHNSFEIEKVNKHVADYLGKQLKAVIAYNDDGSIQSITGPPIKTLKDIEAALSIYYNVTGEQDRKDALKVTKDPSNGVNIQFVIKGR